MIAARRGFVPPVCAWCAMVGFSLLLVLLAAAAEPGVRIAKVRQTEDGYVGDFVMWVPAPRELAFGVLVDFERMPGWVPNLRETRVVGRDGNRATVEHQGVVRYGILTIPFTTLREIESEAPARIRTSQTKGTMKRHESEMILTAEGGGTRIDYHVEVVPNAFAGLMMNERRVQAELVEHLHAIRAEILKRMNSIPAAAQ